MILQQIADQITQDPTLRVVLMGRRRDTAECALRELARLLPEGSVETSARSWLRLANNSGYGHNVWALGRGQKLTGARIDLLVYEGTEAEWQGSEDSQYYRLRLTERGRIVFADSFA